MIYCSRGREDNWLRLCERNLNPEENALGIIVFEGLELEVCTYDTCVAPIEKVIEQA